MSTERQIAANRENAPKARTVSSTATSTPSPAAAIWLRIGNRVLPLPSSPPSPQIRDRKGGPPDPFGRIRALRFAGSTARQLIRPPTPVIIGKEKANNKLAGPPGTTRRPTSADRAHRPQVLDCDDCGSAPRCIPPTSTRRVATVRRGIPFRRGDRERTRQALPNREALRASQALWLGRRREPDRIAARSVGVHLER